MNRKQDFPAYPINGAYFDSLTRNLQPASALDSQIDFARSNGSTTRKSIYKRMRDNFDLLLDTKKLIRKIFEFPTDDISFLPNIDYSINVLLDSLVLTSLDKLSFVTSIYEDNRILAPLIARASQNRLDLDLIDARTETEFTQKINETGKSIDYIMISHLSQLFGFHHNFNRIRRELNTSPKIIGDFTNTAGQSRIKFDELGVDFWLAETSGDLLGPQGITILYSNESLKSSISGSNAILQITQDNVTQLNSSERFEIGNHDMEKIVATKSAIEYLEKIGIKSIESSQAELNKYLSRELSDIEGIQLISSTDIPSKVVNFITVGVDSNDLALFVDETSAVELRSGTICSHLALEKLQLESIAQVSTHIYNTKEDVDLLISAIKSVLRTFK